MTGTPRAPDLLLRDGMVIGRDPQADAILDDAGVSRRHARITGHSGAWQIEDLASRGGTFLNGRPIANASLIIGDTLTLGALSFRCDGNHLRAATQRPGSSLTARSLRIERGNRRLLDDISLAINPGEFVGILGPSGAGKSTLLGALSGMTSPDSGTVDLDGLPPGSSPARIGLVPQDDIVHAELTVRQALTFAALLRLPKGTPPAAIPPLTEAVATRVGLADRLDLKIARLSGGQRKRASVAAELVGCPGVLFLDEPTSGLDPATERQLMAGLRDIAALGCTVVCTTHITANAHLFDRLVILAGGRLVFMGRPAEAIDAFQVADLIDLYDRVGDAPAIQPPLPPPLPDTPTANARAARPANALGVICRRQLAILLGDPGNVALTLGQPVLIAALVAWVSKEPPLALFFAYVATLWFGCGNAAQEIVKEVPLYLRERLAGLSLASYLGGKFLVLAGLTLAQSALLFLVLQAAEGGLAGNPTWQALGLGGSAFASVAIGLAISAWARTALQAVMWVPLILIPQILFSGFVPPSGDFAAGPYLVSRAMPSAAAQSNMDVSLLWGRTVSGALRVDYPSAFSNLNRGRQLKNGQVFHNPAPALTGLGVLGAWTLGSLGAAALFLRNREGRGSQQSRPAPPDAQRPGRRGQTPMASRM